MHRNCSPWRNRTAVAPKAFISICPLPFGRRGEFRTNYLILHFYRDTTYGGILPTVSFSTDIDWLMNNLIKSQNETGLKEPPVCRAGGTRTRTYERPLIEDGCPFLPLRYTARVQAIQPRCSRSFVELVPVAFSGDAHGAEQLAHPFNLHLLVIGDVL